MVTSMNYYGMPEVTEEDLQDAFYHKSELDPLMAESAFRNGMYSLDVYWVS